MKQLQNNFTTVEQSKRLLELGVPANSADCYYFKEIYSIGVRDFWQRQQDDFFEFFKETYIPCWSVGRLIEIFCKAHIPDNKEIFAVNLAAVEIGLTVEAIKMFEEGIEDLDFSKLED